MQLDIFADSRDVMLRNDVLAALQQRSATAARGARQTLAAEYPTDESLPFLATLIDALGQENAPLFTDFAAAGATLRAAAQHVEPAALRLFGAKDGLAWLRPFWSALARRAARLPFHAESSDSHAAPLWLRAAEWAAASESVERIESWRRIPAPLTWMTEATYRLQGLEPAWPLLTELAWLAPGRCNALAARLGDASLDALRKKFGASFEGTGKPADLCWFPAWLLTEKAGLGRWLAMAQPARQLPPERAMRQLLELLGLERQGRHHELIEQRRRLRDLHAGLYRAYMSTR